MTLPILQKGLPSIFNNEKIKKEKRAMGARILTNINQY